MADTPKPPEGYETWLDYACATMGTRIYGSEQPIGGHNDNPI